MPLFLPSQLSLLIVFLLCRVGPESIGNLKSACGAAGCTFTRTHGAIERVLSSGSCDRNRTVVNPNDLTREELIELGFKKDRYIDYLHGIIANQNRQLYSTRRFRYENMSIIQNQYDMIDFLKKKLFLLTGSITGDTTRTDTGKANVQKRS